MRVTIDKVATGMMVREPVMTMDGELLIDAGSIVTDHHIKVLRQWRIESIVVRGDTTAIVAVKPEVRQAIERDVVVRFRFNDRTIHAVKELFHIAVKRRLEAQRKSELPNAE